MLLRNLDIKKGLANGICGTVEKMRQNSVTVLFDKTVKFEPEEFEYEFGNKITIRRTQLPLRLAYGVTVHKSQGMTFDKAVVDMKKLFIPGQTYVALSRTKTLDELIVKNFVPEKIKVDKRVVQFYKRFEHKSLRINIDRHGKNGAGYGDKVSADEKSKIKADLNALRDAIKDENKDEIQSKSQALMQS